MILEQRGFTLIELMIVVAIIGILAAIAIPKFTSMLEKSREGATKGNLGAIRSAIAIYYGDREGVWPTTINHMTWGSYLMSSYLDSLPPVVATYSTDNVHDPAGNDVTYLWTPGLAPPSTGRGWGYDKWFGLMYVNSTMIDSKGVPYSSY